MNKHHIIIPVCGEASRVREVTLGLYPKCLIRATETSAVVTEVLKLIDPELAIVTFVVDSIKSASMIKEYVALTSPGRETSIRFAIHTEKDGSFYAVQTALLQYPDIRNFTALWGDVVPNAVYGSVDTTIYYDPSRKDCRYGVKNGEVVKSPGGVFGMYAISESLRGSIASFPRGASADFDLIEFILKYCEDYRVGKASCRDFGDMQKINSQQEKPRRIGRHFHKIEILNDRVFSKRAAGETTLGFASTSQETSFYHFLDQHPDLQPMFPKFVDAGPGFIQTEFLDGFRTVYSARKKLDKVEVDRAVFNAFKRLHKPVLVPVEARAQAVLEEIVEKSIRRFMQSPSITARLVDADYVLKAADRSRAFFSAYARDREFAVVHADPNMENVMIEPVTRTVKFIDPKGVYGGLKGVGDPAYDYAKYIYGLFFNRLEDLNSTVGNLDLQDWKRSGPNYQGLYREIEELIEFFAIEAGDKRLFSAIRLMIGWIMISVPPFVSQDINKMILAGQFGSDFLYTSNR